MKFPILITKNELEYLSSFILVNCRKKYLHDKKKFRETRKLENKAPRRQLFNVIRRLSDDIIRPKLSLPRILKEFVCLTANDPTKEKRHGHLVSAYSKSCNVRFVVPLTLLHRSECSSPFICNIMKI